MSSMSQPYSAAEPPSTGLLFIGTLLGGILVGILLFLSKHIISLVCLTPFITGLIGGFVFQLLFWTTRSRKPLTALLFALLMGVTIVTTEHTAGYFEFRKLLVDMAAKEGVSISIFDSRLDEAIEEISGAPGFMGYMNEVIQIGTSIGKVGSSSSPRTEIKGGFMIALLAFNALLIIGGCVAASMDAPNKPFCPQCGNYHSVAGRPSGTKTLGQVFTENLQGFATDLQAENFQQAGLKIAKIEKTPLSPVQVVAEHCPTCTDTPVLLNVMASEQKGKNVVTSRLFSVLLRRDQYQILENYVR